MKRLIIVIISIAISIIFVDIPKYEELNNLAIIDAIGIEKENDTVRLVLREIVPLKDDNGIKYDYIYYKSNAQTVKEALIRIKKNTKKKVYLERCSYLVLDSNYSEDIKTTLHINPKIIYHRTDNVLDFVKRIGKK